MNDVPTLHWLTVDEAVVIGGWRDRQAVLAAIRRRTLQAENINPNADPRRYEYRTTVEWVQEYLRHHKRGLEEREADLLHGTMAQVISGEMTLH